MNRRDFLKSSAVVAVGSPVLNIKGCSLLIDGPAHVWDRPLHTVYAGSGRKFLDNTDDVLLNAVDQVPGGVTAMTPFLLNVKDPSPYESMIKKVQSRGIAIVPGVGGPAKGGTLNTPTNQAIAAGYRNYTSYIRLENMQGFYQNPNGQADIQGMIDYVTGTLDFQHVMLNPWPNDGNGNIVPFENPELDTSFNQVHLTFDRQPPYTVHPDPNNWLVNMTGVNRILEYRPTVKIVVNYESAPQHEALLQLEKDNPGSSITAMNITATQCQKDTNNLYWAPPFTHIYDPVDLGTWNWIAKRLGQMP